MFFNFLIWKCFLKSKQSYFRYYFRCMSGYTRHRIRNTINREKVGVAPIVEKMIVSSLGDLGILRRPIEVPVKRFE